MDIACVSISRAISFLALVVVLNRSLVVLAGNIRNYCSFETFSASCNDDEVIIVQHAEYGRMSLGSCITKQYDNIGCSENVVRFMDNHCSGRQECELSIPEIGKAGISPCSSELANYLTASYSCLKVEETRASQCRYGSFYTPASSRGFISSESVVIPGISRCNWKIEAPPGKKVNLTLFDFSMTREPKYNRGMSICRQYVTIRENAEENPKQICGGESRIRNIYLSETNTVLLDIQNTEDEETKAYFLIEYEFVGCPPYKLPANSHMYREGKRWVIACNTTTEKFYVNCDGDKWLGKVGNCSVVSPSRSLWSLLTQDWSSPSGILVVIGLGVLFGIIIGIILLVIVLAVMKRRRTLQENKADIQAKILDGGSFLSDARTYQSTLTYDPEHSTYSCQGHNAWIAQRPLPPPNKSGNFSKSGNHDNVINETCPTMNHGDLHCSSSGYPTMPSTHVYESPKFSRREFHHVNSM